MPNKVKASALIANIVKNGKNLQVKYATETDTWKRTSLAQNVKDDFRKAVEKASVPKDARAAILAETEHKSDSDERDHYTTVYQDEKGEHVATKHVYP